MRRYHRRLHVAKSRRGSAKCTVRKLAFRICLSYRMGEINRLEKLHRDVKCIEYTIFRLKMKKKLVKNARKCPHEKVTLFRSESSFEPDLDPQFNAVFEIRLLHPESQRYLDTR